MDRLFKFAILLLLCPLSLASAQEAKSTVWAEAKPLCALIADASQYDGKEVVVQGLYRMVIHGSILMGQSCPQIDVNLRCAAEEKFSKQALKVIKSQARKNPFQPVAVIYRGIFHVAGQGQCFGQICAEYELEITELIGARPAP